MSFSHLVTKHTLFLTNGRDDLVHFLGHVFKKPMGVLNTGGTNGVTLKTCHSHIKILQTYKYSEVHEESK